MISLFWVSITTDGRGVRNFYCLIHQEIKYYASYFVICKNQGIQESLWDQAFGFFYSLFSLIFYLIIKLLLTTIESHFIHLIVKQIKVSSQLYAYLTFFICRLVSIFLFFHMQDPVHLCSLQLFFAVIFFDDERHKFMNWYALFLLFHFFLGCWLKTTLWV